MNLNNTLAPDNSTELANTSNQDTTVVDFSLIKIKDNGFVDGRGVWEFLENGKKFSDWIKVQISYGFLEEIDFHKIPKKSENNKTDYDLTIQTAIHICRIAKNNPKSALGYQYLISQTGVEVIVKENLRQEIEFGEKLSEFLSAFNYTVITQKPCLTYRIDFYIPKLNIAIEYDELHHKSQLKQDDKRQKAIEKELKCKFIRVSNQCSDVYNLGIIAKNLK